MYLLLRYALVASLVCVAALRGAGQDTSSEEPKPRAPRAPRIVDDLVGRVEDRAGLPGSDPANPSEEYKAYCLALITARATSDEAFANSTREGITFAHLFEQPEKYRGEVIRFHGRLRRVRKFEAPALVRPDIPNLYECGIFDSRRYGANPFIAVVTDVPSAVPVAEEVDMPVTVHGYFFKRYRYTAGDGLRDAPLLIGRTLTPEAGAQVAPNEDVNRTFTANLVVGSIALFGTTVGLMIALSWWYRRGDRRVRALVGKMGIGDPDSGLGTGKPNL